MSVELEQNPALDQIHQKALSRLGIYLESPGERILREHQVDVMQSSYDFFKAGKTSGYISLPPGAGKTILSAELVQALGLKTVILSPTLAILGQTHTKIKQFAPEVGISNYHSLEKDLSGDVINTTYQSMLNLVESGKIDPKQVELLICDEAHTALGDQRHKIFRHFPNALKIGLTATPYFTPLEGYKQRGLFDESEEWLGLFRNQIHEMTLEEGLERGVLAPLDVHLIRTNAIVSEVPIVSTGEYNKTELARALNKEARNNLAIGILAGVSKLPKGVKLVDSTLEEIDAIHNKIKNKPTLVFCLSVDHVNILSQLLKAAKEFSTFPIHSGIDPGTRARTLQSFSKGYIDRILGVDMIRVGLDLPNAVAGLYLAPTHSGIVAVQELGRLFRPSPETGKERAIAIQLVDHFENMRQAPVLIPNIFDPNYILRGTITGREIRVPRTIPEATGKTKSTINFTGLEIHSIVSEAQSNDFLQNRFKQADVLGIANLIDQIIEKIIENNPEIEIADFYEQIADQLPQRVSVEKYIQAIQAIASIDSNTAAAGKKVLLFLNLKTILSAIEPFVVKFPEEKEDIIQAAILSFNEYTEGLKPQAQMTSYIYANSKRAAAEYIATTKDVPMTWVLDNQIEVLDKAFSELLEDQGRITGQQLEACSLELSNQTGLTEDQVLNYLNFKFYLLTPQNEIESDPLIEAQRSERADIISKVLYTLRPIERFTIIKKHGLEGEFPHTLKQIGDITGVWPQTVRERLSSAQRKLLYPSRSRNLPHHMYDEESFGIRWPWPQDIQPLTTQSFIEFPLKQKIEYIETAGGYTVRPHRLKYRYTVFTVEDIIENSSLDQTLRWQGNIQNFADLLTKTDDELLAIKGINATELSIIKANINRFLEEDEKVVTIGDRIMINQSSKNK